jgi:hypothetical protein
MDPLIQCRPMAGSIIMVFLTVPAEARQEALASLSSAETGYEDVTATTAVSFVESEGTQLEDTDLLLVSARSASPPTPALAENFWRSIEATLFRDGVSAVEHMVAYAVPDG